MGIIYVYIQFNKTVEEPDKVPDENILNGSTKNDQNNKSEQIKIEKNEGQANEEANSNGLELEKDETEKVNQTVEAEEGSRITEIQEKQSKKEQIQKERHCICDNNEQFKHWDQVQCDNCETWFHQFCMKLTVTQATFLKRYEDSIKWFCTQCLTKNHV